MPDVEKMMRWCAQQVGKHDWSGKCQGFVADAVYRATGKRISRGSAKEAMNAWMKPGTANDWNPPRGAAVYFGGSGSMGAKYGHVGVSDGNGYVYEAWSKQGIVHHSMSVAARNDGGYKGWGWNGGIDLGTAGKSGSSGGGTGSTSGGSSGTTTQVEISQVVVANEDGSMIKRSAAGIAGESSDDEILLLIQNGDKIFRPFVIGDIKVTTERVGSPGKMMFSCIDVEGFDISEGNAVAFRYNGEKIFYGYIFTIKNTDDREKVSITCYDQLRYFKNKDTFVYGSTYADLLKYICGKYGFEVGEIDSTGYKMPQRVAEGTLFDILQEASDDTTLNKGEYYVLYDDFGKVQLRSLKNMTLPLLLDQDTTGSWELSRSIDQDVYNRIILAKDDDQTGVRNLFIANDSDSQKKWGVLTMYETADASAVDIRARAKALLKYYDMPEKKFSAKDCIGDPRVRGGSVLLCSFDLGNGEKIRNLMIVDKAEHTYGENYHTMSLNLIGGGYSA